MATQARLRKKKDGKSFSWFTRAGGDTYFGNVKKVPYREALKAFREHIGNLKDEGADRKSNGFRNGDLMEAFLEWAQANRRVSNYKNRRTQTITRNRLDLAQVWTPDAFNL